MNLLNLWQIIIKYTKVPKWQNSLFLLISGEKIHPEARVDIGWFLHLQTSHESSKQVQFFFSQRIRSRVDLYTVHNECIIFYRFINSSPIIHVS